MQPEFPLPTQLAIVVPCYNEEAVLPETSRRLGFLLEEMINAGSIRPDSYILFTDDGSRDATWAIIEQLSAENQMFQGLRLSRNFGHQHALLAGLHHAAGADAIISIDADLQDDPNAIPQMVAQYHGGYDVVYGVRDNRDTDTRFKRQTALLFYKLLHRMGVESVYNHADYRLLSRRALAALLKFKEVNLYLRGIIPMLGFKNTVVYYQRQERFAGTSKYNLRKMLSFAWNGVSSLSIRPLRFVTFCGFAIFFLTLTFTGYALFAYFSGQAVPGWASTVIPIYFLGGVQLLCIGLLGEYLGKIFKEIKGRPRFIVAEQTAGSAGRKIVSL